MKEKFKELRNEIIRHYFETYVEDNSSYITTLEFKNYLRKEFPDIVWNQQFVSDWIQGCYDEFNLDYIDNGFYRIYSQKKFKSSRISKTDALRKLQESAGKFITVEFIKKDGSLRKMNGKYYKKDQDTSLGYFKMINPQKEIRNVNIQTLKSIKVDGNSYKVN